MICGSYKASTCVHHQTPWHLGPTYKQPYSSSAKDEVSQMEINNTNVACPRCHARIERNGGCLKILLMVLGVALNSVMLAWLLGVSLNLGINWTAYW
ncbi:hypothetical protein BofuT4_uP159700.1 [Botrytis cinerea T4]|uniref:Uncharacterized protein n=1 Tax=Botryotinia fuckeliana (strain T4) TaxID=999810 RepID=G2YU51_BOTF4|nr:hypothetical protein BofuT4_uP159700.1 [Botrytis cinerea T4]